MPYPSQTTAGLFSRFGESPCVTALYLRCQVSDGCCRTCNQCVEPNSKRLCLLTGKYVSCGCNCRARQCDGGKRRNGCCQKGCCGK